MKFTIQTIAATILSAAAIIGGAEAQLRAGGGAAAAAASIGRHNQNQRGLLAGATYTVRGENEVCETFDEFKELTEKVRQSVEECAMLVADDSECEGTFSMKRRGSRNRSHTKCMCKRKGGAKCGDMVAKNRWNTYEVQLTYDVKEDGYMCHLVFGTPNGGTTNFQYLADEVDSASECAELTDDDGDCSDYFIMAVVPGNSKPSCYCLNEGEYCNLKQSNFWDDEAVTYELN